jgi:polyisoprenoid-binding protein YceI
MNARAAAHDDELDPPHHGHGHVSPEHRRRWLIWTMVVLVVGVALVVGGPWVYARLIMREAPDPLALSTATAAATPSPTPTIASGPLDVDGTWTIADGSEAGYRLGETLSGQQVTVVGRSPEVTGTVTVADGTLTAADVVVDTASIATDESARDVYFRRALNTTDFPEATFSLSEPVDVSAVATATSPVEVSATGSLTFHGVSQPVTMTLTVQRTPEGLEVAGSVPVTLADYGLQAPDLGFVTVEPDGTVEMLLALTR